LRTKSETHPKFSKTLTTSLKDKSFNIGNEQRSILQFLFRRNQVLHRKDKRNYKRGA
jgi:hypothetical protein